MIKFILDYSKLDITFRFTRCENCGLIKITIIKNFENGFLSGVTCVSDENFIDEDFILKEISEIIENLIKIDL